jgi:hypothetical protein
MQTFSPIKLWDFCGVCLLGVAASAIGSEPASTENEKFPFAPHTLISVPVEIFGKPHPMIVAAGVPESQVNESLRPQLSQLPRPANPEQSFSVMELLPRPAMKIGRIHPETFPAGGLVAVSTSDRAFTLSGSDAKGFLGLDYLKSKVLKINFDEHYVQFNSTVTDTSWPAERIAFRRGFPYLQLRLPEHGYTSSWLNTSLLGCPTIEISLFNELVQKRKIVLSLADAYSSNGVKALSVGILDWMEIGPYRLHNVHVQQGNLNSLSLDVLSKFNLELDLPNRLAYLQPSRDFRVPFRYSRSGFGTMIDGDKVLIYAISPGGVGDKAGIRDRDEIVSINGINANQLSIFKIRDLHSEPGGKLTLSLRRGQTVQNVVLQLTKEPDPFPVEDEPAPREFEFDK